MYDCLQVREISEMIQSGIQPLQNVGLLSHLDKIVNENQASIKLQWAQYWVIHGLTGLIQFFDLWLITLSTIFVL